MDPRLIYFICLCYFSFNINFFNFNINSLFRMFCGPSISLILFWVLGLGFRGGSEGELASE